MQLFGVYGGVINETTQLYVVSVFRHVDLYFMNMFFVNDVHDVLSLFCCCSNLNLFVTL